ncbi:unnamed protein product [Prorocentrum cordatum]|uniref:Uncharacterized protein n=1 Tax=Prorocentrum cordatum TaxID=2364126 RepID=A0ABN9XZE2_9DINO|nr:unnamed protein product [Polarella glacialis]
MLPPLRAGAAAPRDARAGGGDGGDELAGLSPWMLQQRRSNRMLLSGSGEPDHQRPPCGAAEGASAAAGAAAVSASGGEGEVRAARGAARGEAPGTPPPHGEARGHERAAEEGPGRAAGRARCAGRGGACCPPRVEGVLRERRRCGVAHRRVGHRLLAKRACVFPFAPCAARAR